MDSVGIILAGGGATRFNGIVKELLPITDRMCSLDTQLTAMRFAGAKQIYVLASPQKAAALAHRFSDPIYEDMGIYPCVVFPPLKFLQKQDFWETLSWALEEFRSRTHATFIGLADTIIAPDSFIHPTLYQGHEEVRLGVFNTTQPNRFSIISGNKIITKPTQSFSTTQKAWGTITLMPNAAKYLSSRLYSHYDVALEDAMNIYSLWTHQLTTYHDIGSFEHYTKYIRSL